RGTARAGRGDGRRVARAGRLTRPHPPPTHAPGTRDLLPSPGPGCRTTLAESPARERVPDATAVPPSGRRTDVRPRLHPRGAAVRVRGTALRRGRELAER